MTPTRRLTIARLISAVTVNFGTAESMRSMRNEIPATMGGKRLKTG
jgi:hypothetical protein